MDIREQAVYCSGMGCSLLDIIRSEANAARDLPSWPQFANGTIFPTYQGRVALWLLCQLWKLAPEDEVLLPAYNCGTEIDPFLCYGVKVILYRVDTKTHIDFEDICHRTTRRTRLIYVTHYFGWPQDLNDLLNWCRERNIRLVEDCALALFSSGKDGPLGTIGDATIFSLRKFLPVPDGGPLVLRSGSAARVKPLRLPPAWRTVRNTLPLLKRHLIRDLEKLGLYAPARRLWLCLRSNTDLKGNLGPLSDMPSDYYFDKAIQNWSISCLSMGILSQIDPAVVIDQRRKNYTQLYKAVREIPGVSPLFDHLPDGVCPFGLPLIVPKRSRWAKALNACGIAAFPFWEGYHCGLQWDEYPDAQYLKDNLLVLPVHQGMHECHIRFIGRTMWKLAKLIGQGSSVL